MARWLWLGSFFFLSIPALVFYEQYYFSLKEPYFSNPTASSPDTLTIRSDGFGKGHFGASRNGGRIHEGIDLLLPVGSPVIAAKSGRVFFAGDDTGYGHYVELHHPDGLVSRYAHLSQMQVYGGEWVSQGQRLGLSGKTGNANSRRITPHLHFEIRYKNHPLNPAQELLDPKLHLQI